MFGIWRARFITRQKLQIMSVQAGDFHYTGLVTKVTHFKIYCSCDKDNYFHYVIFLDFGLNSFHYQKCKKITVIVNSCER